MSEMIPKLIIKESFSCNQHIFIATQIFTYLPQKKSRNTCRVLKVPPHVRWIFSLRNFDDFDWMKTWLECTSFLALSRLLRFLIGQGIPGVVTTKLCLDKHKHHVLSVSVSIRYCKFVQCLNIKKFPIVIYYVHRLKESLRPTLRSVRSPSGTKYGLIEYKSNDLLDVALYICNPEEASRFPAVWVQCHSIPNV